MTIKDLYQLVSNKQKKISFDKGFPSKKFGSDGDITIRFVRGFGLFMCIKVQGRWYNNRFSLFTPKGTEYNEPVIVPTAKVPKRAGELTLNTVGTENRLLMGNGGDKSLKHIVGSSPSGVLDAKEIILSRAKDSGAATTADFKITNTGTGRAYLHLQTSHADADPYILFSYNNVGETTVLDQWCIGMDNNVSNKLKFHYKSSGTAPLTPSEAGGALILDTSGNLDIGGSLDISNVAEVGSDTDKFLMLDSETVKYVDGANLWSYIKAGASLNDLSDVTYSSGDLTISSLDTIVAGGDLTLDVTGDIELNAAGGDITFKDNTDTYASIYNRGFRSYAGALYMDEIADSQPDIAGVGQLWTHDTTPNELCFTDDAGTDIIGVGKYHYETKFIGYVASAGQIYFPMTGYTVERTALTNFNENNAFTAPFNGTIQKICFRSEIAQSGGSRLVMWDSSDGTEVPGTLTFRKDETLSLADDTYHEMDLTSPSVGTEYMPMTKGKIYAIELTTPAATYDTNITIVFKWDITS